MRTFKKSDLIAILVVGEAVAWFLIPVAKNLKVPAGALIYLLPVAMPVLGLAALYFFYLLSECRGKPVIFEIGKFAAVGLLNTVIDFGVLNFLSYLTGVYSGTLLAAFNVVSVSLAVVNSYVWNKFWTFRAGGSAGGGRELGQFIFVSLVGIGINTVIVYFLTTVVAAPGGMSNAGWENIAKIIGLPVYLTWNFIGYKLWVFNK